MFKYIPRFILIRLSAYFMLAIVAPAAASAQVVVPSQNLIANGNFMSRDVQQRPLRWATGMGLQTATITGLEHHGTNKDDQSLKIADSSSTANLLVRTEKNIADPGTLYTASAWVKTKEGTPAHLKLDFWDQNNAIIGTETAFIKPAGDWQQLSIEMFAPDKVTHVTLAIVSDMKDTGISFWDDVSLVRKVSYNSALETGVHELFMDDYRIAQMTDVERVVNPAVKSKILMQATKPWEGRSAYVYGTVLNNEPAGSGYRMWYTTYLDAKYYLCYATSKDGLNWVKPNLGVIAFNGDKNNNICRIGGGTLVYDPDDKDASRRYKLMSFDDAVKENFGYNVYFSPDGFNWTHHPKPVLPYGDVSNVTYDRKAKLFIATTKQRMLVSNTSVTPGKMDRAAFVSVSTDFINWHAPGNPNSLWALAVEGDPLDDQMVRAKGGIEAQVYGMPVYPYQGLYIGLPWFFDISRYDTGEFATTGDGVIQPQIAVSRDLKHWDRLVRNPIVPVGRAGGWDDGTLYTASTMQAGNKEMSIYFGAMNLPHGGSGGALLQSARIARASWRLDGMISLYNGGDDAGSVTTKNITFKGKQLKVNAKLAIGGSLRVEVLDKEGKTIGAYQPSKPIIGDQYAATVLWNGAGDLSKLQGQDVQLRFHLKGGNLYSYWFE